MRSRIFLFLFLFLAVLLLIIAACKSRECKVDRDCADKEGYSVSCAENKCDYTKEVKEIKNNDCSTCKEKPGYKLICDKSTGFSCEYKPVKQTVVVKQNNIFDERRELGIQFTIHYVFNNPFNVQNDTFDIKFAIKDMPQNINSVRIDTIRLLEGQQEILALRPRKLLVPNKEVVIPVNIPPQNVEEVKRGITVAVWFDYNKDNKPSQSKFQKQIPERLTIITP